MNFFRQRREELGLTQRRIAIALDVTDKAVSSWERGETAPRRRIIDRVAAVYKVSPERLNREIFAITRHPLPA